MFEASQHQPAFSDAAKLASCAVVDVCCTTPIGDIKGLATCLNKGVASCPYRKPFGFGHLCYHPTWQQFVVAVKDKSEPLRKD